MIPYSPTTGPDYNPKLREAMNEIIAIIKRHDIAAHVVLYDNHRFEMVLAQFGKQIRDIGPISGELTGGELTLPRRDH